VASCGWLLDDSAEENGGTRVAPGSHGWARGPSAEEATDKDTVAVEGPAGSAFMFDGRLQGRSEGRLMSPSPWARRRRLSGRAASAAG
jgi:hypothetical protein